MKGRRVKTEVVKQRSGRGNSSIRSRDLDAMNDQ